MHVFETVSALRAQVQVWKQQGLKVGFVPTMGNLHSGHLSLIYLAKQHCDRVVASIFVNPLQFGPHEDFDSYPRTFDQDKAKLVDASADAVFYPSSEEMYPNGERQTTVQAPVELTQLLEGASRPGHFDGVTTVVNKFFNMVQPDMAVFGQKDYQQFAVIERMIVDLALPIQLIRAPIARDKDGLALSSRNQYLTSKQRGVAPKLYSRLVDIEAALRSGNRNFTSMTAAAKVALLAEGFDAVDYIEIVHPKTLLQANHLTDSEFVILAVAKLGETRLLDNVVVDCSV